MDIIPWNKARGYIKATWKQSQHFATMGQNGSGKSFLTTELVQIRYERKAYIAVFNTKPKDKTLEIYTKKYRFKEISNVRKHNFERPPKGIVIKPVSQDLVDLKTFQREVFQDTLNRLWKVGNWTVVMDELRYLTQFLGLTEMVQVFYTQARSSDITIIGGTQRPRFVPLEMYSESKHFAMFRNTEKADSTRLSEITSHIDKDIILNTLRTLQLYQFLYVNSESGIAFISKVE